MSEILSKAALYKLVDTWLTNSRRVAGPVRSQSGDVLYQSIGNSGELALDGFIRPKNSIKEFFLPRHEKLYGYRLADKEIELFELPPPETQQIILGARPCDAASLPILDKVFNWDYTDVFYTRRRDLSTVVSLACKQHDNACFCTSVDLSPDSPRGSDAMLLDLGDGEYEVRCFTEKGRWLFTGQTQPSEKTVPIYAGPEKKDFTDAVAKLFAAGFENPLWQSMSLRCLGCGACAYHCPACHCFDIADEGSSTGGYRVRNWDACQFALYSLHASGHNPRNVQAQRQRQRIYHKFQTYPQKFGLTLCTGCGNCTRNCPAELGVKPVLEEILESQSALQSGES
jgi:ferredoxin